MKGKYVTLLSLIVLSLLFTSTVVSAKEIAKIKFYFIDSGSCLVTHGDPGAGPPFLWQGVGTGALMLRGSADGEYFEQPAEGYLMENLDVRGCLLLKWTEAYNGRHWVSVTFYSAATSKGIYYLDPVNSGSIGMASNIADDYIKFKGIYCDGSTIQEISGIAILFILHFSVEGYCVVMQLLTSLEPVEPETTIQAIWNNIEVSNPGFPYVPAAQVFRWNVEIET